jgi:predicted amidohydrolase
MVRIATAQLFLDVTNPQDCVDVSTLAIKTAISAGAKIIVLPELSNSGYLFESHDEVKLSAATLDSPFILEWLEIARVNDVVIIAGINLFEDEKNWNASVIIDSSGLLGWYAKAHLFGDEARYFTPGSHSPLVVTTKFGRIGTMVCYDIEFPEWVRIAMLQGAQLLALPTNWPLIGQTLTSPPMEVVRVQAAASQNKLVLAAADRTGSERGQNWVSASVITTDEGVIAAIADSTLTTGTQIIYADIELPTDTAITPLNDVRKDRRPTLYSAILNQ